MDFGAPGRRLGDTREDFEPKDASAQPRGLPRAVAANHAHHLAALDVEGDVFQGPEGIVGFFLPRIGRIFTNFLSFFVLIREIRG